MKAQEQAAKRNRPQIVIMLVAFPLLCAFGVYSLIWLAERGTLFTTTNRGEFVDPPVLARELGLRDESGMLVDGSATWWIWLATPNCGDACLHALDALGSLRQRLNDEAERVHVALVTAPQSGSLPPDARPSTRRFVSDGAKNLEPGIYLVDPPGNVVFRYPLDSPARPILEDLARLLEVPVRGD